MRHIATDGLPVLSWAAQVDDATLGQAVNLARLPFAFHHIALMADAHVGFGMPIGGVLATRGEVILTRSGSTSAAGCGRGPRTSPRRHRARQTRVAPRRTRSVPTGFHHHNSRSPDVRISSDEMPNVPVLRDEAEKAEYQVGSLGGGNHFIELQADEGGMTWAMVHSGSRNVGKQMGEHYDHVARAENDRPRSPVPREWGLAHLPADSAKGREYLAVMTWCLRFAEENRRLMSEAGPAGTGPPVPRGAPGRLSRSTTTTSRSRTHFGERVWVHRKGAVRAVGR